MASNLSKFMESFEQQQSVTKEGKVEGIFNIGDPDNEQQTNEHARNIVEVPKTNVNQPSAPKIKIKLTSKPQVNENNPFQIVSDAIDEPISQVVLPEPQQNQSAEERRNKLKSMQEEQRRKQQQQKTEYVVKPVETPKKRGPKPKVEIKPGTAYDEALIERLFLESETDTKFHDAWVDLYKKALSSDKQTMTNAKIRKGRFRFDETGKLEILPDFSTYGKTSKDLMNQIWEI